jgi:hypothetical protein
MGPKLMMIQHTMAMVPKSARALIMGSVCTARAAHGVVTDMWLHVLKALRRLGSMSGTSSNLKGRRRRLRAPHRNSGGHLPPGAIMKRVPAAAFLGMTSSLGLSPKPGKLHRPEVLAFTVRRKGVSIVPNGKANACAQNAYNDAAGNDDHERLVPPHWPGSILPMQQILQSFLNICKAQSFPSQRQLPYCAATQPT